MNILLVEDNYLLAWSTAKLIQRFGGHQVLITDEPTVVFRECQTGLIDLVLMDVNLPGAQWKGQEVSGADISHILKTQPETADIHIILLTAYAMEGEQKILLTASKADEFCAKPITDYKALLKLMAKLCQKPE